MNLDIALIKDLQPFLEIFVKEPERSSAINAAKVHAEAAGMYKRLDDEQKKEFETFCNYLWMMSKDLRGDYQKHQLRNPTGYKKWFWDTRPDSKYNGAELMRGAAHEYNEHIPIMAIAMKIAKDHLDEIPNYYSLLEKMEKESGQKANPRRLRRNPEKTDYLPTLFQVKPRKIEAEKPEDKKEKVINYADFNEPRLFRQKPAQLAKNPALPPPPPKAPAPTPIKIHTPRLLIVDDMATPRMIIEAAAEELGFDCKEAKDGIEGIALLDWADAVCVDGRFPSNKEFYIALKATGKPFVIYSGEPDYAGQGELAFVLKTTPHKPALEVLYRAVSSKIRANPSKKVVKGTQNIPFEFPKKKKKKKKELIKHKEIGFAVPEPTKKNPAKDWAKAPIVQSVTFDKYWKVPLAKKWLKKFGFKCNDMDSKPNTMRFRQQPPEHFTKYFSKTVIGEGSGRGLVILTLGVLKKKYAGTYHHFDRKMAKDLEFPKFTISAKKKTL